MNAGTHQLQQGLLDQILERILDIADFFIYRKHVTLSEGALLLATITRGLWYAFFGVTGGSGIEFVFPSWFWTATFCGLGAFKVGSFFLPYNQLRSVGVLASAFVWTFLTILALWSRLPAPAAPTFAVFALMSIFISVRLIRDKPYES